MGMEFKCPLCKELIEVEDALSDRMQCPACREVILVPDQGIEIGSQIAGFRIEERLGVGGMGEVFRATQIAMDRQVALKVLPPGVTSNKSTVDRFIQEVRMSAKLEHPNIVTAFDAGSDEGRYYLAMSFIEGKGLDDRLEEEGALDEEEVLTIALKIARALDYAWRIHKMLHRDIKPANILLDTHGEVKLMDMGIAKTLTEDCSLTMEGSLVGTPFYMSPEQATANAEMDCRADVYSLGATLYHLVTNEKPFDGPNALTVIAKHMTDPVIPPREHVAISDELNDLIIRMMAKDKDDRPSDWISLQEEVSDILQNKGSTVRTTGLMPVKSSSTKSPAKKSKIKTAVTQTASPSNLKFLLAIMVVVIIAGGGFVAYNHFNSKPEIVQIPDEPVEPIKLPPDEEKLLAEKYPGFKQLLILNAVPSVRHEGNNEYIALNYKSTTSVDELKKGDKVLILDATTNDRKMACELVKTEATENILIVSSDQINPCDANDKIIVIKTSYDEFSKKTESISLLLGSLLKEINQNSDNWTQVIELCNSFRHEEQLIVDYFKISPKLKAAYKTEFDIHRNNLIELLTNIEKAYFEKIKSELLKELADVQNDDDLTSAKVLRTRFEDFHKNMIEIPEYVSNEMKADWRDHLEELGLNIKVKESQLKDAQNALKDVNKEQANMKDAKMRWLKFGDTLIKQTIDDLQIRCKNITIKDKNANAIKELDVLNFQVDELLKQVNTASHTEKKIDTSIIEFRTKMNDMKKFESESAKTNFKVDVKDLLKFLKSEERFGSIAFVDAQKLKVSKFLKDVDKIQVEEPWVQYERKAQSIFEQILTERLRGEKELIAIKAIQRNYRAAIDAGLLKRKPNSTLLDLLPKNIDQPVKNRLIGEFINLSLNVDSFTYLDAKQRAKVTEQDQFFFRLYPQEITLSMKIGNKGNAEVKMTFVLVPPGQENGFVAVNPFYIAKHELTVKEYRLFSSKELGVHIFDNGDTVVKNLDYIKAARYCNWLSRQLDEMTPSFNCTANEQASTLENWSLLANATGFCLPTEAQWRRAAEYKDAKGNFIGTKIHGSMNLGGPLGVNDILKHKIEPNVVGAYFMHGNLSELIANLDGTQVKKEVAMGADYQHSERMVKRRYRHVLYEDDSRTNVGMRLLLPINN